MTEKNSKMPSSLWIKITTISLFLWLIFTYGLFFFILNGHKIASEEALSAAIRQADGRDDGEISRLVAEFGRVQMVHCLSLKKRSDAAPTFDQTFQGGCQPNLFLLDGVLGRSEATSVNGQSWIIDFVVSPPYGFIGLLLTVLSLGFSVIGVLSYSFQVRSRTSKLQIRYEQANTETVRRVAQQVGHDLRSPIGALKIVIAKYLKAQSSESDFALSAIGRIEQIASDLLLKGEKDPGWYSVDIKSVVAEIILEKTLVNPRIHFVDLTLARLIVSRLSISEFRRLLSNLTQNSIEASHASRQLVVSFGVTIDDRQMILTIADNGKGIPEEVLRKLRVDPRSHDKIGGSGLGLRYAFDVVKNAGGHIQIDSAHETGTTISLFIPLKSF